MPGVVAGEPGDEGLDGEVPVESRAASAVERTAAITPPISPRASLRISAMSPAIPSERSTSSMPLFSRMSYAMRRIFPANCPALRR